MNPSTSLSGAKASASFRRLAALAKTCFSLMSSACFCGMVAAQDPVARDLADLSIEELMNESVTSVSKKKTRLGDAPAAISLITADDIRRSGLISLPELLRLVPGLSVARIHGNEWSVAARGFTGQYANKLLVLMDGRSVYSPMFAGVYWNAQDLLLEDIDRIEVIRGPGATLWGANAVNGVINVTTKGAKETQGGLVTGVFGTEERPAVSVRYGGQIASDLHYRVYARHFEREGFGIGSGAESPDNWAMSRVGARLDWEPVDGDLLSLQAEYYRGTVGEHFDGVSLTAPFSRPEDLARRNFGGHVIGRWDREFSAGSNLMVQAYYDRFHQGDGDIAETRSTFDLEVQHRFPIGERHDVVWGFDGRYTSDRLASTFYLSFDPAHDQERIYSVFLQDEITLVTGRLKLIGGSKFEHNASTGWEVQPGVRLWWQPAAGQSVWASVSTAVRTPARYDRDSRLNSAVFQPPDSLPILVSLFGKPDAAAEKLTAYELGYRLEVDPRLSFDVAAFYNRYDRILSYVGGPVVSESEPAPSHLLLPLHFENALSGETYGAEISTRWQATDRWRLVVTHAWIRMRLRPDSSVREETPEHQFQIHSYLDLPWRLQWHAAIYRIGGIVAPLDNDRVPVGAYTRLDLGLSWQPASHIELSIVGQNLLDRRHAEYGSFKTATLTEVPRSVHGRVTWRF